MLGISEKFRHTGNHFNVRTIFKTKHTLCGSAGDAQQTKQCVYSIPCERGRCYISQTSRPLKVRIKEHRYNVTQGLLKKSKLAQHTEEEGHKICWKDEKVLQIEPHATYRKYKESAHISVCSSNQLTQLGHLPHLDSHR
jgi:predicted GIY-YIG superfamily endonuclease